EPAELNALYYTFCFQKRCKDTPFFFTCKIFDIFFLKIFRILELSLLLYIRLENQVQVINI
ncbi:MAG TPA: hypothetical protein DDW85_02895, partial [Porphyromonadaceae bacterium]|nr:hypothetical protein [Porphyromonadaceae bacterium]